MKLSRNTIDPVQLRLSEAVATAHERTTEEQRALLAGLLAAAYEARSNTI